MPPEEQLSLADIIVRIADDMAKLEPGPLARLRRMKPSGPGEGDFWRLAARYGLTGSDRWLVFVKLLALLIPKGDPGQPKRLHAPKRALGTALGESAYPESRLLRFLALPHEQRPEALERMIRWLDAHDEARGIDCRDIYRLLTSPDVRHRRKLAETYYRAIDAKHAQQHEEEKAA